MKREIGNLKGKIMVYVFLETSEVAGEKSKRSSKVTRKTIGKDDVFTEHPFNIQEIPSGKMQELKVKQFSETDNDPIFTSD